MPDWEIPAIADDDHYRNVVLQYLTQTMELVSPSAHPTIETWQDMAADLIRFGKVKEALQLINENNPPDGDIAEVLKEVNKTIGAKALNEFADWLVDRCTQSRLMHKAGPPSSTIRGRLEGEEAAAAMARWFADRHPYDNSNTDDLDPYRGCAKCGILRGDHP